MQVFGLTPILVQARVLEIDLFARRWLHPETGEPKVKSGRVTAVGGLDRVEPLRTARNRAQGLPVVVNRIVTVSPGGISSETEMLRLLRRGEGEPLAFRSLLT